MNDKRLLSVLLVILALAIAYGQLAADKRRTAPLRYERGAVASSRVRTSALASAGAEDPVRMLLGRKGEKYPGVARDLFRMENPAPPKKPVKIAPVVPVVPVQPVQERSPEEIAAEAARLDLSRFRFLGYLTDQDSSLFLAKDGELYIVKSGDTILKSYRVKAAGKDFVVLQDGVTGVEVRVVLSGGEGQTTGAPMRQFP